MSSDKSPLAGTMKVKKYILFFVNFLCVIIGLALVIMGIVIQTGNLIAFLKEFSAGFGSMGVYAVVAGLVVFFIAFMGCIGAWKESWFLLFFYGFIILCALLVVVVFTIIVTVNKPHWEEAAQKEMKVFLDNFGKKNQTIKKYDMWTPMQEQLKCCGINTYKDWGNATVFSKAHKNAVPDSCCLKEVRDKPSSGNNTASCGEDILTLTEDEASTKIYTQGCYTKLRAWISEHSTQVTIAFVIFVVVMLVVVVMSCCLAGGIRRRNKYNAI